MTRPCFLAFFLAVLPGLLGAQAGDTARVLAPSTPRATPFHLELGTYYNSLDNGYGAWRGVDVRLMYATPVATPMISVGSQTRDAGTQQVVSVGSYVTFARWVYGIFGVSVAPKRDSIVLFPKLRWDASLLGNVPGIPGMLISAGYTDLRYDAPGGGDV